LPVAWLISAAFHSREPLGAQVGDQGVCRPFEAAGLDQIGHCAHLVDVCLGGEDCGFLGHVEVHVAHLCGYPGHHDHGWATTLGVPFVQLLRRLDHRVEFLGPLVAVCCAFYHSLERLGEPRMHIVYAILNACQCLDHL
jgi:hypothetical protein